MSIPASATDPSRSAPSTRRDALFADDEPVTNAEAFLECFDRSLGAIESMSRRDHYRQLTASYEAA